MGTMRAANVTKPPMRRWAAILFLVGALGFLFGADAALAQDAASLRAKHAALRQQLSQNAFQRPIVLESTQNSGDLKGDVYAVVDQPFSTVGPALEKSDHWCDILILHLNVKHCRVAGGTADRMLTLRVGRKYDQPIDDAYKLDFAYRVVAAGPDYLQVQLNAENGPLGTKNYRIVLEAIPLDAKRSFIHMSYSYAYGLAARLAMEGYLATIGRDKVGFSIAGHKPDGKPIYVGNVRGVVERNTMRYFLAIEAYLDAVGTPSSEQVEKRLRDWFASVERYPVQLHEMERDDYLEMKRKEVQRMKTGSAS